MTSLTEKGGGVFEGIKLLLCENPLPPIDEAIAAAQAEAPRGNYYTEAYSGPLRRLLSEQIGVPDRLIHINAGSELILRQLFDRFGRQVHLLTPTYSLFPEIAKRYSETRLLPENDFSFDLSDLRIPEVTTLVVIVNPNNPNGGTFDMAPLPNLLRRYPGIPFLVDEAFIGLAGQSVAHWYRNIKICWLHAPCPKPTALRVFASAMRSCLEPIADDLNQNNDAYPLARPSEAAAIATLHHESKIRERVGQLRRWTEDLAAELRALGVRTFPTETYFFLADFAPRDANMLAALLKDRNILVKPLNDPRLGPGYMRVTTALPQDNARFVANLRELL
jgi:histidinol-phosphate aminotransferase